MPASRPRSRAEPISLSPPGRPDVVLAPDRDRPHAFTLAVGGTEQSWVDLDDPTRLEFDYIRRMADVLDLLEDDRPRRVVHIGVAGLSLPRYLAATRPRTRQVVLEPDAALTDFVRVHLPLPVRSGIKVRDVDGRSGLAAMRAGYADVVVLDAYADSRVPGDLTTVESFELVRHVLAPDGLFLLNLADVTPFGYTRDVVAALRATFTMVALSAEPATLKGRRFGNVLAIAGAVPLPLDGVARAAARSIFPYRLIDPEQVARVFAGGTAPTDAAPRRSPAPPHGPAAFS